MPDIITELWSLRKIDNKSAVRAFDVPSSLVSGNLAAAAGLVAATYGCFVNFSHPWNPNLRVTPESPQADQTPGFPMIRVTVNYALGNQTDPGPPGPLKIKWNFSNESTETDVDVEGNPIINAAGDTFSRLFNRDDTIIGLDVTKQILPAAYDAAQAVAYADTYNTDSVGLFGIATVDPGQVRCVSYVPDDEYAPSVANTYITVRYKFEIKQGTNKDTDGIWDAFRYRVLNVGNNGWWDNGGNKTIGPFYRGPDRATNVLLDASGIPYDANIKVTKLLKAPVANPNPLPSKLIETGTNATFLKYRKRGGAPFAALGIF